MKLIEWYRKQIEKICMKKEVLSAYLLVFAVVWLVTPFVVDALAAATETTIISEDSAESEKRTRHRKAKDSLAGMYLREPVWRSAIVHRESSVLIDNEDGQPVKARLAFPAQEVLLIKDAAGKINFANQGDWKLEEDCVNISILNKRGMESIKKSELFKPKDAPQSYRHRVGKPDESLLYAPGSWFHDRNLEITYRRKEVPALENRVIYGDLSRTRKLLKDKLPFVIGISGDSISTGLDASSTASVVPFQLGYAELVAAQLETDFSTSLEVENRAVAGWSIANGVNDLEALLSANPSLVIVAYGMNDVGRRDPNWFRGQLKELINKLHNKSPQCDILVVSPMLGNSEWVHTPPEMFDSYRDVMKEFVGEGVALVDVTEVWKILSRNKNFLDMTGNGLNHPNDFGHRLYAMALLEMFPR